MRECACGVLCALQYAPRPENTLENESKRGKTLSGSLGPFTSTGSPPLSLSAMPVIAGFSRWEVGWSSGSRAPDSSWGLKHIPILPELFLSLRRQIVAPGFYPPPSLTPFMCQNEGEGCSEWQACESSLSSAQQTFFLQSLCAICSHCAMMKTHFNNTIYFWYWQWLTDEDWQR